jgi:hypothetical protein
LGIGGGESDERAEPLDSEAVKSLAIEEFKDQVKSKNLSPINQVELQNILHTIVRELGPRGLKSLSLEINNNMEIMISAEASPSTKENISFNEIFEAETEESLQEINQANTVEVRNQRFTLQEALLTPLETTVAVVTVDGGLIGNQFINNSGGHAEENLVNSDTWEEALRTAELYLAQDPEQIIPIILAINRSPCAGCARLLVRKVRSAKSRLGPRSHFILASSVQYRGGANTPGTTREILDMLASSDWDIRAIIRAEASSSQYQNLVRNASEIKQEYIESFNTRMTSRFA